MLIAAKASNAQKLLIVQAVSAISSVAVTETIVIQITTSGSARDYLVPTIATATPTIALEASARTYLNVLHHQLQTHLNAKE